MSAHYECDMCGEQMEIIADAILTIHESSETEEYHFCNKCVVTHLAPVLNKTNEALEERAEAWRSEFDRKSKQHAANDTPAGTVDRPGFW